jgi:hypothetical protein
MMSAQTVTQKPTTVRQTLVRYRRAIALGLLGVVAALGAYRFTIVPAAPTFTVDRAQAALVEPAQQGVLDYVRAHQIVAETRPLDPAQQSVLRYVQLHSSVEPLPAPAVALDPVQQSVMDYLRAQHAVGTRPVDPAQQSVLDYLRAHNH